MTIDIEQKDLVVLVADKNMEFTIKSLLTCRTDSFLWRSPLTLKKLLKRFLR
ncbi:MAG: hypothetical protein AB1796_05730 [Bacillota bacterium]